MVTVAPVAKQGAMDAMGSPAHGGQDREAGCNVVALAVVMVNLGLKIELQCLGFNI